MSSSPMHVDPASVIREHAPFVWRVLRHLGVSDGQLDDVSQEVFLVVFRQLPGYQARSSLRTWIYGICRNVAATARRTEAGRRELASAAFFEAAEPAAQDRALWLKQAHAQLVQALDSLEHDQRAIFVLYEIEELSMEEIALALQAPITTCYSRLYAAREKVQAIFRRKQRVLPRILSGGVR